GAKTWGSSTTGARISNGSRGYHVELEEKLATFLGREACHISVAGYISCCSAVAAFAQKGDMILADKNIHSCLVDATRLSMATVERFSHNNPEDLRQIVKTVPHSTPKMLVVEGVYSMEGHICRLPEIAQIGEETGCFTVLDDAHGFGVLGPEGRGTAAHLGLDSPRLIYMATLGKAAGSAGAFVAGHATIVEWIMQRARSYIFATATPALVAEVLRASVKVIREEGWRRAHLARLIARLRDGTATLPWDHPESFTAIQPLIIGGNAEALAAMTALRERGIWAPAIRPPTVPEGTARLRVSLSAAHSEADVDRLVAALHDVCR
ncbi:MAG: 8-amino-7-oxononanoate synthase, partial [Rhizobacter sp.]